MRRVWKMSKIIAGAVCRPAGDGVLAVSVLALVLQLLTSSMGYASQGTWIEICSDFGTEYVQVDLSDASAPDQTGDRHDCFDCVLCAATLVAVVGTYEPPVMPDLMAEDIVRLKPQTIGVPVRRAWPETRGPPAATKNKADRAFSAIMASIQVNGGAL